MEPQLINTDEPILVGHEKELKGADDDEKRPNWANLQSDARNMVFSHLIDFDWIRFRLTCKEWQSVINVSEDLSTGRIPWLMFFSKQKSLGVFDFFHPISNETYAMQILELADCTFHCSRYGWVLVSRGLRSFFFFNSFIPKSTIQLPDLPGRYKNCASMSFASPPTTPDCIVFAYDDRFSEGRGLLYKCCRGQHYWDEYDIHLKLDFRASLCTPVSYQGVFYQIDKNGRLGVLDPKNVDGDDDDDDDDDNEYSIARTWEDLPKPTGQIVTYCKSYITVSWRIGISACESQSDLINIFKLDWSTMEWVKLENLGNKTMFVHKTGSLLVKTNDSTENKIYFPKFRDINASDNRKRRVDLPEHNVSLFYSLETHRYHGTGTDFSCECWTGINGPENCVWIQPNVNKSDEVEDNWFNPLQDDDDDDEWDDQSNNNGSGDENAEDHGTDN